MRLLAWLRRLGPAPTLRMEVDDSGVRRERGDGVMEEVTWNDLACVEIVTTDEGPFVEDVFWLFLAKDHGCALPGRLGSEILAHLDRLPGYDAQAVIRAMGSTENARFRVWTRDDSRDAPRTDAKD